MDPRRRRRGSADCNARTSSSAGATNQVLDWTVGLRPWALLVPRVGGGGAPIGAQRPSTAAARYPCRCRLTPSLLGASALPPARERLSTIVTSTARSPGGALDALRTPDD